MNENKLDNIERLIKIKKINGYNNNNNNIDI